MGNFPQDEEYTIIPVYIWKQAQVDEKKPIVDDIEDIRIGIDVARFGSDQTSLAITIKNRLTEVHTIRNMDTTEVSKWVDRIIRKRFNRYKRWKQVLTNVDTIGVGAGVEDQLKNTFNYERVNGFKVSQKAVNYDKYLNKRAEMYWQLRQGLKEGEYEIGVHDEEIENQITAIKYEFSSNGQLKVESKKKIKKRLGESPDNADSICMAFYQGKRERKKGSNGLLTAWK
jgi:NOL1/NOP2/fmu family ribosome biogenesis protein